MISSFSATYLALVKPKIPKYVEGMLALCKYCGYTSIDFNRCQRCRRKFPDDVKSIPVLDNSKKNQASLGSKERLYPKPWVKLETSLEAAAKSSKRGRQPVKRNRKLVEEPVCLTLSSDEEDRSQSDDASMLSDRSASGQALLGDGAALVASDPAVTSSAMDKEPVIPDDDDCSEGEAQHSQGPGVRGGGRELDLESIIDGSMPGSYTLLQCRTVRIGSYKVVPRERVILSTIGIRIAVPSIEDETKSVTLSIDISEIRKVLIHFGRGMPVLFFYTMPAAANRVRESLKMESKEGPYYDPKSADDTQRRITLLPERLHEESKVALKNIFGSLENVLAELSNKEANDILVRASPKEVQNMMRKAVGMSPQKSSNNEIHTIMVYPPPPAKGGIPINSEDYACLGEDQFLNDVIIDFYLKYLTLSVLSEYDQTRTHVFSSFFYKRLTTRPGKSARRSHPVEDNPKLSPAEKRHSRVKNWTKNVNLFQKDFIVIPINEHCHWFLAIICFPGLIGCVRMSDNTPVVPPVVKRTKKTPKKPTAETEPSSKALQIGSTTITPVKPTDTITLEAGEESSDRDEAEGEDEDMEQGTSEEEDNGVPPSQPSSPQKYELFSDVSTEPSIPIKTEVRSKGSKLSRESIKQPCILIFDSLAGASRTRVVATLRDYLRIEYKMKEGKERDFSKDTIKGASPKVPQQTNFTDCGVYLLQYVESFFQDPVKDYHLPMRALLNWFPEEVVTRKREELHNLLLSLMEQSNVDIDSLNLPKLSFPGSQPDPSNGENNVENMEISTQEETVDGGLVFTCTEEEEGASSNGGLNISSSELGSSQEVNCTRTLVNYSDSESEERSSMAVDSESPVGFVEDNKKTNAMSYLKAKRIERHVSKELDAQPSKKLKADDVATKNNFR